MRSVPVPLLSVLLLLLGLLMLIPALGTTTLAQVTAATPIPYPRSDTLPAATPSMNGPIRVVTTLGLIADWVKQTGGDRVEVTAILPANADPHEYDPKPADVSVLEDAAVIFTLGLGLDNWSADLIDASGSDAPVVPVTAGLDGLLAADEDSDFDFDPHVWFDPTYTAQIVAVISSALAEVDPAGQASYESRAMAYQQQLNQLDQAIQQRIETILEERRKLITNHDALGYYANRYGLVIVGTVIPRLDSRAEASAAEIADLIDVIEAENVPAIFSENIVPPDLAETIASQTDAQLVTGLYTDSLGEPDSGADTYLGLMQTDTELIVSALSAP